MRITTAIAISSMLGLAGAAVATPATPQISQAQAQSRTGQTQSLTHDGAAGPVAYATATARVYHSVTREPLAFMPVYVVEVATPEATDPVRIFTTGRDGTAFISPLQTGFYSAFVYYNNNSSNVVTFEVDANTDYHPIITLFFNPDLDN